MQTISIKLKLIISSLLLVLFLIIAVISTWLGFSMVSKELETARLFDKQRTVLTDIGKSISEALLLKGSPQSRLRIQIGISIYIQGLDELKGNNILGAKVNHELVPMWLDFKNEVDKFLAIKEITAYVDIAFHQYLILREKTQSLSRQMALLAVDAYTIGEQTAQTIRWIVFVVVGLLLIGAILLLISIFRTVTIPLTQLTGTLVQIADDVDFSLRADVTSNNEVGQALKAFNHLMESLQFAITNINSMMRSLADEDFTKRLNLNHKGDLHQIEKSINSTANALQRNIEAREKVEQELKLLSTAMEQSPVSVVITDPDGDIEYVNPAFEMITGYSSVEVIGKNPRILKSGNTPVSLYRELWQTIKSGRIWEGELQNCKKDGELYWEKSHITSVRDEKGEIQHFVALMVDTTLQKEQEEKILQQAHYDTLTMLPNRFLSLDRLGEMIKRAQRSEYMLAIIFIDLDDFKKVNDTLGHETGDQLLKAAALRFKSIVRAQDTVGRLGGDEFLLLLDRINNVTDVVSVAENVLLAFQKPFTIKKRNLVLTSSIGITIYPEDGNEVSVLLRKADTAMYHSKEEGRNTFHFFTDSMNLSVARRMLVEEQLRLALKRNELYLEYQPIVEIKGRRLVGSEALLRWNSEILGNVYPEEFIKIAEETGLILEIGDFVLKEAITHVACWRKTFEEFKMAVNASPQQFRDIRFLRRIEALLNEVGLTGKALEIEITEGVLMTGHSQVQNSLMEIQRMGVSISMDDFGTGYSSLSYLRSYPFNTVKIDRSFISDIITDEADRELVVAAKRMSHGLGLKVIAEGVENESQMELLRQINCDYVQGWLLGKPKIAAEFEQSYLKGKYKT